MLKCITTTTTKLVERFFVQGNNLRFLEMGRCLTNDAFSFLLLHGNNKDSDVSIRSQKDQNVETYSYSLEIDHNHLLWSFLRIEHDNLFTVEKNRVLRLLNRDQ